MKPVLRIGFADFWPQFDPRDNVFVRLLGMRYELVFDAEPQVLFYSVFGKTYRSFNCLRIFYTGERVRPDFHECDYSLTFEHDTHAGRNLRFPLYALEYEPEQFLKSSDVERAFAQKSRFCNFVYSNPRCIRRNRFFRALSRYKLVDSGGSLYNNMGARVGDKVAFLRRYKFTIAFENGLHDGYTTEKLVEPMLACSVPVYWGNRLVSRDFDSASFVNCHEYGCVEAVIERLRYLDNNDAAYCALLARPWFRGNTVPPWLERGTLARFLTGAIESAQTITPVAHRRRFHPAASLAVGVWHGRRALRRVHPLRLLKRGWDAVRVAIAKTI